MIAELRIFITQNLEPALKFIDEYNAMREEVLEKDETSIFDNKQI